MRLLIAVILILVSFSFGYSQSVEKRKYNLDYQDYDETVKNARGWGRWGFFETVGTELQGENNYVGKVVSDRRKSFGCSVYKVPVNFKGDSVRLTGLIKTENVRKGYVGLIMRVDGLNNSMSFDNSSSKGISGTNDWQLFSMTLPLVKNAKHIIFGGILSGEGTAWFDDFEIFIDGKNIADLEEKDTALTFLDQMVPEVRNVLSDVKDELKFDENANSVQGLKPLIKHIGDKKIVSIGEDTHGTSEFYKLRASLTKALIKEKGFKTLVLENPYDDVELLYENLNSGNLDELMKNHLFSIYQTKEMKEFLNWIKLEGLALSIKFKGCDDSRWIVHQLIDSEISFLGDAQLNKLNHTYQELALTKSPSSRAKENKRGIAIYNALCAMDDYMTKQELQNAQTIELFMNAKSSYSIYSEIQDGTKVKSRDELMADRITFIAENSNDKVIVWAHNAHISNQVVIDNEIGLMGNLLKQRFDNDYFSIGLNSLNGTYRYMENNFINDDHLYTDELKLGLLSSQPELSWEGIMGEIGNAPFYIISEDMNSQFDGQTVFGKGKLLGYAKESKEDYYDVYPFSMFDGLIFIKNTTATTPLVE